MAGDASPRATILRARVLHTPGRPVRRRASRSSVTRMALSRSKTANRRHRRLRRGVRPAPGRRCDRRTRRLPAPGPRRHARALAAARRDRRHGPRAARLAEDAHAARGDQARRPRLRTPAGAATSSAASPPTAPPRRSCSARTSPRRRKPLRGRGEQRPEDRERARRLRPRSAPRAARDRGRGPRRRLRSAERWHGHGRLRYAVTPRFSISCSEEMLESCGAVAAELDGALVTSHLNENRDEVEAVLDLFEEAEDYLETYERHGLAGPAHGHAPQRPRRPTPSSAGWPPPARRCAHCPSSNGFLGSGIFPMRRHLDHGVGSASGPTSAPAPGSAS